MEFDWLLAGDFVVYQFSSAIDFGGTLQSFFKLVCYFELQEHALLCESALLKYQFQDILLGAASVCI